MVSTDYTLSAAVSWEFDHPEADPTPPGGGPAG